MTFALPTEPDLDARDLLDRDGAQAVALRLLTLHPVEVTETLEPLSHDERLRVVTALPVGLAAQVLVNGDAEFRSGLLERLSPESLAQILHRLPIEHAAQILDQLDDERQEEILSAAAPEDAAQIEAIRRYAADPETQEKVRRAVKLGLTAFTLEWDGHVQAMTGRREFWSGAEPLHLRPPTVRLPEDPK